MTRCFRLFRATALLVFMSWMLAPGVVGAEGLDFRPPASAEDPAAPEILRDLAVRVLPVYQDKDPQRFLANVSALQMAARNYTAATVTRRTLKQRRRAAGPEDARELIFDLYAQARATEGEQRMPFATALSRAYAELMAPLDDHEAYAVSSSLSAPVAGWRDSLEAVFDRQRNRDSIGEEEAIELVWTYLDFDAHRSIAPLAPMLNSEAEARRYVTETLTLKTRGGGISVLVVRPRDAAKLPALLEFSIDASANLARECAAHGFVGVVASARGPAANRPASVPYESDGEDARAVIAWIAKQGWSDGRVGMYGEGYSGFTAWAAAKHPPAALRAIATSGPTAPGIDVPMAGGIVQNSAYRWSLALTSRHPDAEAQASDEETWRQLDQEWYRSGRRYRDLGLIHGKPSPIFIRWLNHPSYDAYWQGMIPYREQFARIDFPVLTTTGYFAASQPAALHYFQEHRRYNPRAQHTLLIGPYDEATGQREAVRELHGYERDPVAMLDLRELRYQWFDHVLKAAAAPALLADRVNYQVMGANEWRSAPDIAGMAGGSLRFFLDSASVAPESHHLSSRRPPASRFLRQSVDLKDRSDAAWTPPEDLISKSLASRNGLVFISDPLTAPLSFNGLFSGRLDLLMNKMDVDLNISLYELTPAGDYVRLYSPTYEFRASYARERGRRHLLQAGVRQQISFRSERMTSRQFQAGSRLVMLLGIGKRPDRELNYGTGNDVSEESLLDADEPYRIRWYADSYIDVPVRR